jgi:hypothetical protein|tara:strand:- start:1140 stop:1268 length:129 start_codon:yes stop_codon:yes gene_type:complete
MMEKALELLSQIEENINTCCAITMEPDEVQSLIDELRKILEE